MPDTNRRPTTRNGIDQAKEALSKPDFGADFIPEVMGEANGIVVPDLAPQPLDHFKRGYRERAELRDREMSHLNVDFDPRRNDRVSSSDGGGCIVGGVGGGNEGENQEYSSTTIARTTAIRTAQNSSGGGGGGSNMGSSLSANHYKGGGHKNGNSSNNHSGSFHYRSGNNCNSNSGNKYNSNKSIIVSSKNNNNNQRKYTGHCSNNEGGNVISHSFNANVVADKLCVPGCDFASLLGRWRGCSTSDPGYFENGKAITAILSVLARRKRMGVAMVVWQWMLDNGVERNVFHFNSMISVCEKMKDWKRAVQLMEQMDREGVAKNEVTFSSAISACEKSGNWRKALELLGGMEGAGIRKTPIAYNAAISACEKGLNPAKAMEIFSQMKREGVQPTVITYSALISACEKGQQWKLALEVLDEMKAAGHGANVIAYSACISALSKGQQWRKALELFLEIERSGGIPSVVTYNSTMTALEKGLEWEKALDLFDEMKHRRMPVTVVSYGSAIAACEKGYQWQQCLDFLDEMTESGIRKNVIIFGAAMSCMEKCCRADIAFKLMDMMRIEGVSPNVHIYNSAISACARCGLWEKGLALFNEMERQGVVRDVVTYNAVLDAVCSQVKVARKLFQQGVEKGFYARVSRLGKHWLELDLHFLSLGGGEIALGWWFSECLVPYLENSEKLNAVKSIDIVTGYGKTRMRGARAGDDGMRKRVKAMLQFMNVEEIEQPNKGRIHIDKAALQVEVRRNNGRIVFDQEGYKKFREEETTANQKPEVQQKRRPRGGAPRKDQNLGLGDDHQGVVDSGAGGNNRNYENSYFRSSGRGHHISPFKQDRLMLRANANESRRNVAGANRFDNSQGERQPFEGGKNHDNFHGVCEMNKNRIRPLPQASGGDNEIYGNFSPSIRQSNSRNREQFNSVNQPHDVFESGYNNKRPRFHDNHNKGGGMTDSASFGRHSEGGAILQANFQRSSINGNRGWCPSNRSSSPKRFASYHRDSQNKYEGSGGRSFPDNSGSGRWGNSSQNIPERQDAFRQRKGVYERPYPQNNNMEYDQGIGYSYRDRESGNGTSNQNTYFRDNQKPQQMLLPQPSHGSSNNDHYHQDRGRGIYQGGEPQSTMSIDGRGVHGSDVIRRPRREYDVSDGNQQQPYNQQFMGQFPAGSNHHDSSLGGPLQHRGSNHNKRPYYDCSSGYQRGNEYLSGRHNN